MIAVYTREDASDIVEFAEIDASEDLLMTLPLDFAERYGIHIEKKGSATLFLASGIDKAMLNRVVGLGLREPATEAMVDDIMETFRRANVCGYMVQVSPAATPNGLSHWLERRGMVRGDFWYKVIRIPDQRISIKTELRVGEVGMEHAAEFGSIACAGFNMQEALAPLFSSAVGRRGWHHFLAWDGETPVATGGLFVKDEIGWLGVACTLPSHRRMGAQGAIMAARIRKAAALGCKYVVTETFQDLPGKPNPSYHNMLRTGFELVYERANYVYRAPEHPCAGRSA